MDETMRTQAYSKMHHSKNLSSRSKRSVQDEPLLRIQSMFKKQRLDVDEEYWKQRNKELVPYGEDGLDFPNDTEETLDSSQYELIRNLKKNNISLNTEEKEKEEEERTTVTSTTTTTTIIDDENNDASFEIELSDNESKVDTNTTKEEDIEIDELNDNLEEIQPKLDELEVNDNVEVIDDIKSVEKKLTSKDSKTEQIEMIDEEDADKVLSASTVFSETTYKKFPKPRSRVPKKYFPGFEKVSKELYNSKGSYYTSNENTDTIRFKRNIKERIFPRYERLDEDGNVILEWDPSDEETITFRITARTLGYVGIGFNEKSHMKGADIFLAWVDDHTRAVNLLVFDI
ncbi:hypothetical protein M0802_005654 [Mischocyttarus mexicanus]|nr:hypothetical protein M0802_005654 [Mischocyttarus mexicanus]